ncbi:MAG: molybdopterin-guanine dinucleotide biosynthesis protein B [Nitrospinae bacterium]|nr:molybdopterin-guanine dinucleotide biosynthesis protein B [Nitrospinota bacterium]
MDVYWEQFKTPFLCVAGYSGVGKTTLLEDLIKRFSAENFSVGYYKHDAHRFVIDKEGKDTHRARSAGAGIIAVNDPNHFAMVGDNNFKKWTITHALEQCDCILIEGYKQSPFNKIVFLDAKGDMPIPLETPGIKAVVHQGVVNDSRIQEMMIPLFHRNDRGKIYEFVRTHFISCASPLYGAVFVGGQSKRMGKPKFSLSYNNGVPETERMIKLLNPFCEKIFISSRSDQDMGTLANLPDVERINDDHIGLGPVGGLATLMSRHPDKAWMITACDMPFLREKDFEHILKERDPLRYGTCYIQEKVRRKSTDPNQKTLYGVSNLPLAGASVLRGGASGTLGFEPMCAIYEPKFILPLYETMSRQELSLTRTIRDLPFKLVKIPEKDRTNFMNTNTPEEYETARLKREQERKQENKAL